MAERIIDDLESIEIDEEHRELPMIPLRGLDRKMQKLVEHLAIGQICQAVMGCEVFDPLVRFGLFIDAVEVFECERDAINQTLQQLDEFRGKRIPLDRMNEKNPDWPATVEERQRGGRFYTPAAGILMPVPGLFIVFIVVGDAGPPRAKGDPGRPPSFRMLGRSRKPPVQDSLGVRPCGRNQTKEIAVGDGKSYRCRGKLTTVYSRLTNEREQLVSRLRSQNCFVGRGECRIHACEASQLLFRRFLFGHISTEEKVPLFRLGPYARPNQRYFFSVLVNAPRFEVANFPTIARESHRVASTLQIARYNIFRGASTEHLLWAVTEN